MKALQGEHRIVDLCAAFGVSRSGYYRWRGAKASPRACKDALITEQIRLLHTQSRHTYGRPRLCAALRNQGMRHSPKRVARLMKAEGLNGVRRGKFNPKTTVSDHPHNKHANLLLERAPTDHHDQVWVADITFVSTTEGWLYVAAVLDRHSRRLLGMAFGARMDSSLPEAALRQAISRRGPQLSKDLLHHSDQGVQYASTSYQQLLAAKGITCSMSRRANCYDNAHMESFWGTLKAEALDGRSFPTRLQAQVAIFDYVETFYNRLRLHSALGFLSPVDFESINI
jgi:transposase InsO family protein